MGCYPGLGQIWKETFKGVSLESRFEWPLSHTGLGKYFLGESGKNLVFNKGSIHKHKKKSNIKQ